MTLLCFTTDYFNKIDITQRDGFHQINQVWHYSEAAEPLTQAVKTLNSKTQGLRSQGS
jgi:hypothetical protein